MKTFSIELENEFEADVFAARLEEADIPYTIVEHYSLAYNGLFQMTMGWGHIEIPEQYREKAWQLYEDYKASLLK